MWRGRDVWGDAGGSLKEVLATSGYEPFGAASKEQAALPVHKHIAAGSIAGWCEVLVMFPLDVVKTRFQISTTQEASVWSTLRSLVRNEGFGVLYRGILPPIVVEAPKRAIKFTMNEVFKHKLTDGHRKEMTVSTAALSGAGTGVVEGVFIAPFEGVKIHMQDKKNRARYTNSFHAGREMLRDRGLFGTSGIYRGMTAACARNATWAGVYFTLIFSVKQWYRDTHDGASLPMAQTFGCGVVAGAVATFFNTPFDTVKTRQQMGTEAKWSRFSSSLVTIVRTEGYQSLWRGFVPKVLRLGPGGGIMLLAFDVASKFMA